MTGLRASAFHLAQHVAQKRGLLTARGHQQLDSASIQSCERPG